MKTAFGKAGHDISPEEFVVMNLIEDGKVPQSEILRKLQKEKTVVTRTLKKLELKKLIVGDSDPEDKRNQWWQVTDSGRALKQELFPLIRQVYQQAIEGLNEEEIELTRRTLSKIAKNLG
jgi:DNA-binding MarR family transcriptional regulator